MTTTLPGAHPIDSHVGQRIALRRKLLKLSRKDLARHAGISTRGIQEVETGSGPVTASVLCNLSHALGVPMTFFFEGLPATALRCRSPDRTLDAERGPGAKRGFDSITVVRDLERIADPRARRKVRELVKALADAITSGR